MEYLDDFINLYEPNVGHEDPAGRSVRIDSVLRLVSLRFDILKSFCFGFS